MAYLYVHIWLPIFAVFTGACAITDGFSREPTNHTAIAGETVILRCTVNTQHSSYLHVYWYKSFGFSDIPSMPISSQRTINTNADSRYSIIDSGSKYNLQIRDVDVGDTSYYKCRYYDGDFFDSQTARLTVYDESLTPRCRYEPLNPTVGSFVYISCFRGSSASRSSLSLWRGVNGHQVTNLDRQSDGSIRYRLHLRANDNNRTYTCNYGRTYIDIHNCSVTPLNIPPTISLTPGVNYGIPDDEIRFSCKATGLPVFSTYRWLVGTGSSSLHITKSLGRYIFSTNGDSTRLTIIGLKLSDNNTAVRCVAVNDIGHRQVAFGKMIVQSSRDIPTDLITTDSTVVDPGILQSTRGSVVNWVFTPEQATVTERGERVVLKSAQTEGVQSQNTKHTDRKPEINISLNKSSDKKSIIAVPIVLTLLLLLLIVIVILVILIKKTDKAPPEFVKRLSLSKPAVLKRMSLRHPQFLERANLRKSWQGAKRKVDTFQKRATWGGRTTHNEDKRQSIRDQIEVVVNPPPPEWKLKVEDVDKAQRQRLISHYSPTGGYSAKEKDLLTSLVTGTIQMKTLDKVEGLDIITPNRDEVDNQLGSDLEEKDPDEMSKNEKYTNEKHCKSVAKDCELPKMATIVRNGTDSSTSETDNKKQDQTLEVIYANTNVAMGKENDHENSSQADDSTEIKYAELDLKLSGPWDENDIIETEPKTAYAVIDHTKKSPVVRSTCDL